MRSPKDVHRTGLTLFGCRGRWPCAGGDPGGPGAQTRLKQGAMQEQECQEAGTVDCQRLDSGKRNPFAGRSRPALA